MKKEKLTLRDFTEKQLIPVTKRGIKFRKEIEKTFRKKIDPVNWGCAFTKGFLEGLNFKTKPKLHTNAPTTNL